MKTLEEIKRLIDKYARAHYACGVVAGVQRIDDGPRLASEELASQLVASLAAWDAVLQECLPALRAEYESLQDDSDGTGADEGLKARVGSALEWRLSPTGLARLEYLRGILGEEAP